MSQDGIKQVIGRAVVDAEFRNLLFSNSAEALRGFDLTPEEAAGFKKMPRADFDKLLSDVETRVSKAGINLSTHAFLKSFDKYSQ
jgi:hypothetical protein